jgi:uncharacterized membrane protein
MRVRVSRDLRLTLSVLIISTIVVSTLALAIVSPRPVQPFFSLYTLGERGNAEHYYPNDDPNLLPREILRWYVVVYNHMGNVQYVAVRVKLLNSTMSLPDDSENEPSPEPVLLEFKQLLMSNETWIMPFTWQIDGIAAEGNVMVLYGLTVNNQSIVVDPSVSARNGHNFRIILELWTYKEEAGAFSYAWSTGQKQDSVWNQIWFNVTATAQSTLTDSPIFV